ncbi:MAG TPA: condensation domain-containing protein [Haliangium sp.]|nr:condensation domain-containing protein [Haliangium sp.]
MSDLARRIAALSPAHRQLLARRLGIGAHGSASLTPVPPDVDPHGAPLTIGQLRMWDTHQRAPGAPINVACQVVTLSGALDVTTLEASVQAVIARHAALRTTFVVVNGTPRQIARGAVAIERLELAERSPEARDDALTALAKKQAWTHFDVEAGPLVRVALVRMSATEHALLVSAHNLVFDAWSFSIMLDDLIAVYNAGGNAGVLPPLLVSYRDYAYWHERWLASEGYGAQLAYWRDALAAPLPAPLLTDMPRSAVPSDQGQRVDFALPPQARDELAALARKEGVTMFMVFVALVQALIYRRAGTEEVIIGTLNANRALPEIERVIGYFLNVVPLRTSFAGATSFRELLGRVRKVALGAQAHAQAPYERLVQDIAHQEPPGCNPLFDVLFVYENVPPPKEGLRGVTMTTRDVDKGVARYDLTIAVYQEPDRLHGWLEYRPALFREDTVRAMIAELVQMVEEVMADPGAPVARGRA